MLIPLILAQFNDANLFRKFIFGLTCFLNLNMLNYWSMLLRDYSFGIYLEFKDIVDLSLCLAISILHLLVLVLAFVSCWF